jgi:hypothetical protein
MSPVAQDDLARDAVPAALADFVDDVTHGCEPGLDQGDHNDGDVDISRRLDGFGRGSDHSRLVGLVQGEAADHLLGVGGITILSSVTMFFLLMLSSLLSMHVLHTSDSISNLAVLNIIIFAGLFLLGSLDLTPVLNTGFCGSPCPKSSFIIIIDI